LIGQRWVGDEQIAGLDCVEHNVAIKWQTSRACQPLISWSARRVVSKRRCRRVG
jgi:hypothetical protein